MFLCPLESEPIDRRLVYEVDPFGKDHCLTIGTGTYFDEMWLPIFPANKNKPVPHILLGRFSSISKKISFFMGGNHNYKNVSTFPFDMDNVVKKIFGGVSPVSYDTRPNHFQVIVGHDVWIGYGAMIMGGVKIASGAVIGANSVVAKDVPPYSVVVGNPARVIKYRFDEATIKKFLAVKWWNWPLEKIADNLPLMNDVEKFLAKHWSPELEQIPQDEIGLQVENFRAQGFKIYNFVADFGALQPLWLRVVAGFCQSNYANAKLVIWLDKNSTNEDFNLLTEAVKLFGNDAGKNILAVDTNEKNFPQALRNATHFITNREMSTLECLDWLWGTNVKIVSALDEGIFDGEPPVDWQLLKRLTNS